MNQKYSKEYIMMVHKEYANGEMTSGEVFEKYNIRPDTFTKRANKLGLQLKPKGFQVGNNRGKVNNDQHKVRVLWFYRHLYKRRAIRRGRVFELTEDEFYRLCTDRCHYCGKGYLEEVRTANRTKVNMLGLDRVDPTIGYVKTNVVPCCKRCNIIKNDQSADEFKKQIKKMYHHMNGSGG